MIDIEEKEPKIFDKEPAEITIDDAKKYFNAKYLNNQEIYDTDTVDVLAGGVKAFTGSLKKMPEQFRMMSGQALYTLGKNTKEQAEYQQRVSPKGDMIFNGNLEVKLGDSLMESGRYNIMTANRNLETLNREIENEMPYLTEEDRKGWTMMIAEQGLDYATMLGLSYINPYAGIGYMSAKILGQETEEGAEAYKKKYGTIEGFEELSGDELALNIGNTAVQAVIEKAFGAPAQLKRFKTMKDFGKAFFTGFGEEFLTENLQNVSDAVFDYIGKRFDEDETIWTNISDNFKGTIVAGMFGGIAGTAFAIHNRAKGIESFEQLLDGSDVPVEQRNALATELYESGVNNMQSIVTKELELNSQLRAKHGAIYDRLKSQIERQYRDVGAFEGKTEAEIAQYIEGTAKQFADNTLAEAQKRNMLIDDVVNSQDIVYENGRLQLKQLSEEQMQDKKNREEYFKVADENARLDDIYPAYDGESININGVDKTVYNSNGDRIAKSKEALENFYRWFGDSKVVDEQGRPLVVYHGTYAEFDTFNKNMVSNYSAYSKNFYFTENKQRATDYGNKILSVYLKSDNLFDVELNLPTREDIEKINTILAKDGLKLEGDYGFDGMYMTGENFLNDLGVMTEQDYDYLLKEIGYDGIKSKDEFIVFNPNQIKSTSNRGTYSESENIYYQKDNDRDLVALHSISASNLEKAIDFGGFPVPSIAIVKKGQEFHFDDLPITLVGNKEMIDPYDERNEVYNRDVWTKTFPWVTYKKPTQAKEKSFKNKIGEYYKRTNSENELGSFIYVAQRGDTSSALSQFQSSSGAMLYYLENIKKQKVEFAEKDLASDILERAGIDETLANEIQGLDIDTDRDKITKAFKQFLERKEEKEFSDIKDAEKREKMIKFSRKLANENYFDKDGNLYFAKADTIVTASDRYFSSKGKKFIDQYEVRRQLRDMIANDENYQKWATEFFEKELVGDKMVRVGNALKPFTLENVVDAMTTGATVASQETPLPAMGKVIAAGAKRLESIKDIKEEGKKLVTLEQSKENMEKVKETLYDFLNMFEKGDDFSRNMDRKDAVATALQGVLKNKNITKESLKKAILRQLPSDKTVSDEVLSYGVELANEIKGLARYYFEAKPQRAVGLNEFSAAIMPTSSEFDAIAKKVEDKGLKVIRSDDQVQALRDLDAEDSVFFQSAFAGKKGKIKGAFDRLTKSIKITKDADFSTYQHEFAHFWLDNIWDYVNSGKASAEYIKQFNELKKWLGVKPNQNYFTRTQHEKFARGYEKFLYEGKAVNPIIASAFDDYEKFIRDVYDDITEIDIKAGKKYEPLTREAYNFFNSMVSGKLTPPANLPSETVEQARETVAKSETEAKETVAEETKILKENRADYSITPVKTDTKTGYLTAYEKMTGEKVESGVAELDKEIAKAREFVENNPDLAEKVVNGEVPTPDNMLKNTIYLAYEEQQKKLGNTDKRVNALLNQAQELRAYGQEIASQKLAYADQSTPFYWISRVMSARAEAIAESNKMTVQELQDLINKEVRPAIGDEKAVENVVQKLKDELGVKELYQAEQADFSTKDGVYKYVTTKLGIIPTTEQATEITKRADDMLTNLRNAQVNGNPSVEYFVKYKDLEDYANSIAPSSNLRVLVSVIGKGNLLASFKSPLTNVIANTPVAGLQAALRRQKLGIMNSIVNPELIKQNKQTSWEIYRKTGYTLNNMTDVSPKGMTLGEKITQSQGEGAIRKVGRIYENIIYKWSLGAPDLLYKDFAFNDYVALAATKESGGDVAKANEIYKDAVKIMPETELGQRIRQEAIDDSLVSTYQNNGKISESALKIRKSLDFGVGFGEFIAPFVKTPANVVGMGLDTAFGSVRAITNEIIRDVKAGKVLTPKSENIRLIAQNGLGLLVASLLLASIDDDDYMPGYALATNKDKQLAKELNIPFNSIRIGDTWYSMDYLGPLASPLMGLLQARREDGTINSVMGYIKSGAIQTLSIPALGNIGDLQQNITNLVRKDGVDALGDVASDIIEATVARSVPSIISDIAKVLDEGDREAKTLSEKLQMKLPIIREDLPERYNVTTGDVEPRAESTIKRILTDLFAGARVKEQVVNDVADELFRLNSNGYGVSLTDVTRSGLLSKADSSTKALIKRDFAKMYSKGVKELISSYKYRKSNDEDRKDMIDSLRRKYVNELKKKYLKKTK